METPCLGDRTASDLHFQKVLKVGGSTLRKWEDRPSAPVPRQTLFAKAGAPFRSLVPKQVEDLARHLFLCVQSAQVALDSLELRGFLGLGLTDRGRGVVITRGDIGTRLTGGSLTQFPPMPKGLQFVGIQGPDAASLARAQIAHQVDVAYKTKSRECGTGCAGAVGALARERRAGGFFRVADGRVAVLEFDRSPALSFQSSVSE